MIHVLPTRPDVARRLERIERRKTVRRLRESGYWPTMQYLCPFAYPRPLSLTEACAHLRTTNDRHRLRIARYFLRHARATWSKEP